MSDLPFQRAIKLRDIKEYSNMKHTELITEETRPTHRNNQSFQNITGLSYPTSKDLIEKVFCRQIIIGVDL